MRKIVPMLVTAAVLAAGSPAHAAAGGPGDSARAATTRLTLAYTADAGYAAAVVVTCDPPGGAHPQAGKVCRTLARVDGDPAAIKPAPVLCTLVYAPVTAQVTGTWRGRPVDWSATFGNTCEMVRATGVLFTF